ncbi:HD domain-containing protein [Polynucleobacter paneuropaeus]|jgi:HD-GYP domain-containing protein (c-di-GMP phosphodiesterase class II)|uniref:HD domain-containing protein n=1 Tax=Polynucleobacter paneuropaeus TaxID=2527775 RepID=A0AAE2YM43_9BURK|nr:HD domain-containing protein [Polynucleobacter paneuropaeus]MBT8592075.1 HD domain-containing protein [Polynucleobacter paneuropaeus]MBT8597466.1 HD domain-containing protein [Polynucleobacter paneuropaeus]MBT8599279.1 HD domain-containing protein [Polynucleobacter paneuropaeus]MBT8614522.1 HD domain-containing protein [Polynucleobacter paneuropaeus]
MDLLNQIFYFSAFIILMGLMLGFVSQRDEYKETEKIWYWPAGLFFLALASFSFFIASWGSLFFLTLCHFLLMCGMLCIALLFRSWRTNISQEISPYVWVGFSVLSITFLFLFWSGDPVSRIYITSTFITGFSLWNLWELRAVIKHNKAPQIKILIGIIVIQIVLRASRIFVLYYFPSEYIERIFHEGEVGFSIRIISSLMLILACMVIAHYYLDALWKMHRSSSRAIESGLLHSLNALSMVRDNETGDHILRTQAYVKRLAERLKSMGIYADQLTPSNIEHMVHAAPLHDIGKVGIPDNILRKNGALSPEEWEVMKTHAALGERVLKAANADSDKSLKVLEMAIDIAGGHHEKWDGSGYPRGLSGEEIPLAARIMSLADIYDALVNERVYKEKWTHEAACEEIARHKGKIFDPAVVEAFILEKSFFQQIAQQYAEE